MREARYAALEAQARASAATRAAATAVPTGDDRTALDNRTRAVDAPQQPDDAASSCGHRSIGNKSCQRPSGHAEKNHRYK
jgi:hypothetical protein